jgi:predicted nucleic acid-binding protein
LSTFIDTSGVLAVLNRSDQEHRRATVAWEELVGSKSPPVTTSYVLIELVALAQNRLGIDSVRDIDGALMPLLQVVWVDAELHSRGLAALLAAGRRRLSLVDCVSFEVMREHGIETCFTTDKHFAEHGFEPMP